MKKSREQLPTISIITTAFNSNLVTFERVLKSIQKQDYPRDKIEHIVADAGSTNGTVELAKKYKCKVLIRKDLQEEINARMYEAVKIAKNDIIAIIETDNPLPTTDWLKRMVEPFKEEDVFSTYNAFNCVEKEMPLLSRYCALFGVSDPVLYYLGKSEKMSWHNKKYNKGNILKRNASYSVVIFTHKTLPTLGDNGCLIKRKIFLKTKMTAQNFIHLDLFSELLDQGFDTFGAVHNCIFHSTGTNIIGLIQRRILFRKIFFEKRTNERKYLVYDPASWKDKINLLKFCFYTITFIEPLWESIWGYRKLRDTAWFLHPVMCWVFFLGYSKLEIEKIIRRIV